MEEFYLDNTFMTKSIKAFNSNAKKLLFDKTPFQMHSEVIGTDSMSKLAEDSKLMVKLTEDYRGFVCNGLVPAMINIQNGFNDDAENVSKSFSGNAKSASGVKYSSEKSKGANSSSAKNIYDKIQKQYGFTDSEMAYLKEKHPNELSQLYALTFCGAGGDPTDVYNKLKAELVENSLKNPDGTINMKAVGNLVNQDAENLTFPECLALCSIFDQLTDAEKSEFITSAYTRNKIEEGHYTTGGGYGHYQYTISSGFQMIATVYSMTHEDQSSFINNAILEGNENSAEVVQAQKAYRNENLLYTYAFLAPSIEGAAYDDKNSASCKLPEKDFEVIVSDCKDRQNNIITVSTIATYETYAPTPSTAHSKVANSAIFYAFPYMPDVTYGMTETNNFNLDQLKPTNVDYLHNGKWDIINDISTVALANGLDDGLNNAISSVAPTFVKVGSKFVPVVGSLISVLSNIANTQAQQIQDQQTIEIVSTAQENNIFTTNIGMLGISGAVIGSSNGTFYITNSSYDEDLMQQAFDEYNSTHPNNQLDYNSDTFINDLFSNEEYYNSLDEGGFFNYYATYIITHPKNL